ncbi:MAG TPA: Spy/CpxP family protein refolding chaperone [Pyrinomonadaceae bacterium]|nr:Spy/CpxP family protein refolding chaperone [Pyrinomonadaceae bacterium]
MFIRKTLVAIFALLALSAVTYAQESQVEKDETTRPGRGRLREGRRHARMGRHRFGGMRELNLTEEQRKQQHEILQRHLGSLKGQREELFKLREKRIAGTFPAEDESRARALRQEIHNSMQGMQTEMDGILTAEQRAKLEQLKTERKARREEMREHRRELRELQPR